MVNFEYAYKAKTICYNGCVFDSSIELKYALMIENTHAWLRDGIENYYGINVQEPGIKAKLHCYRPDFLVRNLTTGVAELVEIKPDGFCIAAQQKRSKIVRQYLKRFAYDWTFRIVTESEITISPAQWLTYKRILATQNDWHHQPCMQLMQNTTTLSDQAYQHFVRTGLLPTLVP